MTIDEFFAKYNGVGVDFDGYFGDQCVDLYQEYNRDVVGGPVMHGNAIDFWNSYPDCYEKIRNTPDNCPQKGDVVIWGVEIGQFGHIAVCSTANPNTFVSFDQNWDTPHFHLPDGESYCRFVNHSYDGVLGWLRPKTVSTTPVEPPTPVEIPQQPVPDVPTTSPQPSTDVPVEIPTTIPSQEPNVMTVKWYVALVVKFINYLIGLLPPKKGSDNENTP